MTTLARHRPEDCLSDLALDRLMAGELDGAPAAADARAHLASCALCAARLAELRRYGAEFEDYVFVAGLVRRTARRRARPQLGIAVVLAAAAAIVLVAWPRGERGGWRAKGGVALGLVVRHADGRVDQAWPGDRLVPGEAVRFQISTHAPGFVAVVGLDAAGVVTAYVPPAGQAVPIGLGRDQLLPGSIILDETLGAERVVALVCPDAVAVDRVVEAGRTAMRQAAGDPRRVERLEVPCDQATFLMNKVRER